MAYTNPSFDFRPSQPESSLDARRPSYFESEDSSNVLDPAILDADMMQSPHNSNQFRKDSFASNGVLSPPAENSAWDSSSYVACNPEHAAASGVTGTFHGDRTAFVRHSVAHQSTYRPQPQPQPQQAQWNMDQSSGQCTPTHGLDFMPQPQFEGPPYALQRTESAPSQSFARQPHHATHNFNGIPVPEQNFIPAPQVQTPMSPHSHQDWMAMAAQEGDRRPMPKRMRPQSPPRTIVDLQRRDGIRKKNGRIEIPQERNIHTIDELIDKTTDEDLLKELKQQKRLLRNREAALASRQRKKKHTEDLEVKEKGYAQQIVHLEKEVADMQLAHNQMERDRQLLWQQKEEARRHIDVLQEEKRDLAMRHTEETSLLRRRIQILTDQLEHGSAPSMSAAPSSTGFADFNAEMEALNMNHDVGNDWDSFFVVNDLHNEGQEDFTFDPTVDQVKLSPKLEKKASTNTIVPVPPKLQHEASMEQPIASGLLFMLLLCGAFVASNPQISSRSDLPRMPPDVQRAAPTVLSNLLAEAGSDSSTQLHASMPQAAQAPGPSSAALEGNGRTSRLDHMHRRLTVPSKQQEADAAFSMTPAQYASLTEVPIHNPNDGAEPMTGRRNLAHALASIEHEGGKSKAEVYTRSLLWDQIPVDVVKQFREMVRDQDELESQQQQHRPQTTMTGQNDNHDFGNMFPYKLD
ncbi:hypothetical protein K431DRAFT_216695 [Polychaeton citri CBS 116435]|uniref:BZIP domain-containing protein n=1 Tax=Polychaeton citri CBS 116435 TaxID=1314669 RepID=A0A9P4UUA5_9PEZI|nr:hypothetical protein K431DRAFT_216695 [Polychaeton citri CBS 116435]